MTDILKINKLLLFPLSTFVVLLTSEHLWWQFCQKRKTRHKLNYVCPRGTQTCAYTHPESDQHQNWTCSRGSPPAPTHQIWWWSMNPFLRYLADKQSAHRHTDRQTDRQTDTRRWPQDLAAYGAQVTRSWQIGSVLFLVAHASKNHSSLTHHTCLLRNGSF